MGTGTTRGLGSSPIRLCNLLLLSSQHLTGPNIANFALGFHGHAFEYPEDTHDSTVLPPHLPLSGPNSAVNFDFDFPLPQWEPTFADGIPLPDIQPDEASAYARPEPGHAMAVEAFGPEMPWFEEDPTSLTTDNHTSTPPARVARKETKKDKDRADSTASGSAYSASNTSTQEAFPFPDPSPNPLNPPSSNRRRSTRTKGRAKSVTTTTSASSSSTAPTPGARSQPSTAEQPPSRLRSASRASKNSISRPSDTLEDRRTRASHNLVEKQYRSRLNAQFEGLLGALPDPEEDDVKTEPDEQDPADKKVSKAEVLERARKFPGD
ncbi:hypothetical protein B0T11DRAFT_332574 [Plectosphaerella cucumerina]|uniref:BHLH domain-containing protein n=1 Tax=Plectosphaerella cucumerina TaxID=40658 RepID=A0A8K0WYJ2_9PEZI|nr:hypothetical protein B0T11DRAFT_332574 [Plectosphaerella cucumerina]